MFRIALRGLRAHLGRVALGGLGVVLAVGFVAGTFVLTDTLDAAFDRVFALANRGIDVIVRAETAFTAAGPGATFGEQRRVPARLLRRVRRVDGVAAAEGFVMGYAQIVTPEGEPILPQGPPTIGVSWMSDRFTSLVLREGRRPGGPGEVAVDARTARRHDLAVGERITVISVRGPRRFRIVGIAGFGAADDLGGSTLVAFEPRTARRVLGAGRRVDEIDVIGTPGLPPAELRDRVAAALPPRYEVATATRVAEEQSRAVREALGFLNTALLVFAGISVFVAAFVIHDTFSILVAQRTREIGLLRAVGASPLQISASVLAEAAAVGAVASAAGVGAGVLMARALRGLLELFGTALPAVGPRLAPRTVAVALGVGVAVTLASALWPARRASRVPPLAALREAALPPSRASSRRRAATGILLTAAGAAGLAAGLAGRGGLSLVGAGAGVAFLGVAALTPFAVRPFVAAVGWPLPRLLGAPGKLGRENLPRDPRRAAAAASALMVGLALVATFATLADSVKASAGSAIRDTYRADLALLAPDGFSPLSPRLARELRGLDAVGLVSELRTDLWRHPGTRRVRLLTGVDPDTVGRVLDLDLVAGSLDGLDRDGVLLHEGLARDLGLGLGDPLRMEFASSGTRRMEVAGIFADQRLVGPAVIGDRAWRRNLASRLDRLVMVVRAPGASPTRLRREVQRVARDYGVRVLDQGQLRREQEGRVDRLLGLITALLALAVVIALLGIMNTLALSVLERTREIGLLRAVGLSRRQARAMVRTEALLIALLGGSLGLAVGCALGWALVRALADEGLTELSIPLGRMAGALAVAGLAGIAAAVAPARRAARLDVLAAIAHE